MARWRLTAGHYLNSPGTTWEYKEVDQTTGRQARKVFDVPLYLHPDDKSMQNREGEIIVCWEGKGERFDYVFIGPPTPDMEPLDDEAKAITERERPRWKNPIDSAFTNEQGYSQSLIANFEKQMAELMAGQVAKPAAPVSVAGVDPAAFAKMQEQMELLMEQNAELQNRVASMRRV